MSIGLLIIITVVSYCDAEKAINFHEVEKENLKDSVTNATSTTERKKMDKNGVVEFYQIKRLPSSKSRIFFSFVLRT